MARIAGWFGDLGRRVVMLLRREKFDSEMDEEMRLHREMKQKELEAEGVEALHGTAADGERVAIEGREP
jgi:hypothetical protein